MTYPSAKTFALQVDCTDMWVLAGGATAYIEVFNFVSETFTGMVAGPPAISGMTPYP